MKFRHKIFDTNGSAQPKIYRIIRYTPAQTTRQNPTKLYFSITGE